MWALREPWSELLTDEDEIGRCIYIYIYMVLFWKGYICIYIRATVIYTYIHMYIYIYRYGVIFWRATVNVRDSRANLGVDIHEP